MVGVHSILILCPIILSLCSFKIKNSIAGNRTRGANVKGLNVTNYTTMDYITILKRLYSFSERDIYIEIYIRGEIDRYFLLFLFILEKKTGSDQPDSNQ